MRLNNFVHLGRACHSNFMFCGDPIRVLALAVSSTLSKSCQNQTTEYVSKKRQAYSSRCRIYCCFGVSLIDWIQIYSDTLSQGYTNLQSLVKCLDHRNIVSDTVCNQAKAVLGCAMHWNASRRSLLQESRAADVERC